MISGAAGFLSGGVFAHLATIPRRHRRLVASLLILTSVLAMVAGFVILILFSRIPPPSFCDAGVSLGRFAFWFAFGTLNVALLRRSSTARGKDAGG